MRISMCVLALLNAATVYGETRPVPHGPDLADLYARTSESAYVVRGRLLAAKSILRTDLPAPEQVGPNLWRAPVMSIGELAGRLYTVGVEKAICRREDFAQVTAAPSALADVVYVFVPAGDPQSTQSRFDLNRHNSPERLLPDRDYLLFLYAPSGQDALLKTYELEPGVTYYRTMEGERGAVALPDAANPEKPYTFITPLVNAVTTFCEAVKGPDTATKIRQLQGIRDLFPEPPDWRRNMDAAMQAATWRKSVDAAIHSFQTAAPQPPKR